MSPSSRLGVVGAVATLLVLFEMLRRQRLREKYALIWVVVAIGTVLLVIFPGLLAGRPRSWASRSRPTCSSSRPACSCCC